MPRMYQQDGQWVKECTKCHEIKTPDAFGIYPAAFDRLQCACKTCLGKQHKEWKKTANGQAAIKRRDRRYYERHRDQILEQKKEYAQRPEVRIEKREWAREYRKDPEVRLSIQLRIRIWSALSGKRKYGKLPELVGCTVDELRQHIESL